MSWSCNTSLTIWLFELLLVFTTAAILFTSTRRYSLMTRSASPIACGVTTVRLVQPSDICDKTSHFQTSCSISYTMCRDKHMLFCCTSMWRRISMGFWVLLSSRVFFLLPSSFQYSSHFSHSNYTTIPLCPTFNAHYMLLPTLRIWYT